MKNILDHFTIGLGISLFSVTLYAQSVDPQKELDNRYSVTVANVYFEINADMGGRVSSFTINGEQIIHNDWTEALLAGSTFWPSPQSVWGWPPSSVLDSDPYAASVSEKKIILESDTDSNIDLSFVKTVYADLIDTSVSIEYTIKNTSASSQQWAPWEVTRVPAKGITFFEKGEGSISGSLANKTTESASCIWYDQTNNVGQDKFFCDGKGWIAHLDINNHLFIKKFENIDKSSAAPGEAEVEVYTAPNHSYTELEDQGMYATIESNSSFTWKVKWFARILPSGIDAVVGNQQLVNYVKSTIGEEVINNVLLPQMVQVNVYPNPTKNRLFIQSANGLNKTSDYTIYSLQGQQVLKGSINMNNTSIDVSSLLSGSYILILNNNLGSFRTKVVIVR